MPEFLHLLPPAEARTIFFQNISLKVDSELIQTKVALGRVLSEDIVAQYPLPSFPRSTVDGYAVRAHDTHGANESLPAYLTNIAEVPMGAAPDFEVSARQTALIHTGGMLPSGTNAVVMVEYTQAARDTEVEILRAVGEGENVLKVGEDIKTDEVVMKAGINLRPAEIGGLMALGVTEVSVAHEIRVGIISSGDEVIDPHEDMKLGQVRDINSYTLSALVAENGAVPQLYGIVGDDYDAMFSTVVQAIEENDLVIITAGSSASTRDLTSQVIRAAGDPGVLVHGVNVRPGKPTILGVCGNKPVVGLPGNPVSALVIARLFVLPVLDWLAGKNSSDIAASVSAKLAVNLASQAGREDWVTVSLKHTEAGWLAEPVFGKSNLIFTLVRAQGLLRIPADATGISAGDQVEVRLI